MLSAKLSPDKSLVKIEQAFRMHHPRSARAINTLLLVALPLGSLILAYNLANGPSQVAKDGSSSPVRRSDAQTASITIRSKLIRVGDTADTIFETLKPGDSKKTVTEPDPANPQSLLVTRNYEVEGNTFSLTFARTIDPGPYRLVLISMDSKKVSPSSTAPAPPRVDKLRSCNKDDAQSVLESMSVMATEEETKGAAKYYFKQSWWETVQPKVGSLIQGTADADACVHQEARLITFYDPDGKEVGVADPIWGVRSNSR